MARKHKHPEHLNAEAWAIPYGDLVTLLLALFVVMYAMSSVNEGKYRVMSEAMSEAFNGTPRTLKPVQVGDKNERGLGASQIDLAQRPPKQVSIAGLHRDLKNPQVVAGEIKTALPSPQKMPAGASGYRDGGKQSLARIAKEVEQAMQGLIQQDLIVVRRKTTVLEIEIKTDILFASGVAGVSTLAQPVLLELGRILQPFGNRIRVEGHTDNVPIATASFPSNWELSAARAASVVHVLLQAGVAPQRLSVSGMGEFHPAADNGSVAGRNANRRVVLVVLAGEGEDGMSIEKILGAEADPATPPPVQTAKIMTPEGLLPTPLAQADGDPTVRLAP